MKKSMLKEKIKTETEIKEVKKKTTRKTKKGENND